MLPLNLRVLLPVVVGTTLVGVSQGTLRTAKRRLLLAMKEPRRRVSTFAPILLTMCHDTIWLQRTARVVVVEEEGVVVIAVEGVGVRLTDIARQARRSCFYP